MKNIKQKWKKLFKEILHYSFLRLIKTKYSLDLDVSLVEGRNGAFFVFDV